MVEFDVNKRFNFFYLPGMEIKFMAPDLVTEKSGIIKSVDISSVEIEDGTIVDKLLIFDVISKEGMQAAV